MPSSKPIASLSLDLDNKWSYMKTHGDAGWNEFPSYLDEFVPRALKFFADRKLRITFFVVGQDAAQSKNRAALQAIAADGHEIGNHSFSHEPWMHHYPKDKIHDEIVRAAESIESAIGKRPLGFRGPGYSSSPEIIEILEANGYLYDASSFPTFLGPLARAYYFRTTKLTQDEANVRRDLFGPFSNGFRTLKAHCHGQHHLIEIPVTTMPVLRTPFHVSYLLYLSRYSMSLALSYFRSALQLCRVARIAPSLLLHPPDFLGCDDKVGLEFFPGMQLQSGEKMELLSRALEIYGEMFAPMTLEEHARSVAHQLGVPQRTVNEEPNLSAARNLRH